MSAPEITPLVEVAEAARRHKRSPFWVRAEVLPDISAGSPTPDLGLPFSPPPEVDDTVLLRADVEDDYARQLILSYPARERWERGRDFVVGDATGRAVVRVHGDGAGHWPLDPQLTLHLDQPFREASLGPRRLYLHAIHTGDVIWLHAPAHLEVPDANVVALATSDYRSTPELLVLGNRPGGAPGIPWEIYDAPAFAAHAAWEPWHRKLSVLVRSR